MTTDPLTAAWLAEMWPVCREESREEREVKRALDAAFSTPVHRDLHKSTGPEVAGMDKECA
ncbi:hypothetical protein [Nocardioides sp.]|uniref:hypothetical protein n=1 Tax=Nocardioides sp. TaxID=35761 RepID=UPI003562E31C